MWRAKKEEEEAAGGGVSEWGADEDQNIRRGRQAAGKGREKQILQPCSASLGDRRFGQPDRMSSLSTLCMTVLPRLIQFRWIE